MSQASTELLAWWGATLSTILLFVKFWEIWSSRVKIAIGYQFTTDADIGDQIFIRNLTGHPVIIEYWQLQWRAGRWPVSKVIDTQDAGPDVSDIHINAHSSATLYFKGADHLGWPPSARDGAQLFIEMEIAGKRRPIRKKVYSPKT